MNDLDRRDFLAGTGMTLVGWTLMAQVQEGPRHMYGLIGKMRAISGQRGALVDILLAGTTKMPGCVSYIVALDPADPDGIWITEVWDTEANHKASLSLPAVQAAIAKGKPLVAGFAERFITSPVGGVGLPPR